MKKTVKTAWKHENIISAQKNRKFTKAAFSQLNKLNPEGKYEVGKVNFNRLMRKQPSNLKNGKKYLSREQGICAGTVSVYLVHNFFVRPLTSTKKVYQKPTYHSNIFCTFSHFCLLNFFLFYLSPEFKVQS